MEMPGDKLLAVELLGIPRDTSLEFMRLYMARLSTLPPEVRLESSMQFSASMSKLAETGVRMRHPEYDDGQVLRALRRMSVGEEIYRQHFPGDNIQP